MIFKAEIRNHGSIGTDNVACDSARIGPSELPGALGAPSKRERVSLDLDQKQTHRTF